MSYSENEVRTLAEGWAEYRHVPRIFYIVRYADLSVALRNAPPHEYQAVLLYGLIGLTLREAATILGCSPTTVAQRYEKGIKWLTDYLNGGYRD